MWRPGRSPSPVSLCGSEAGERVSRRPGVEREDVAGERGAAPVSLASHVQCPSRGAVVSIRPVKRIIQARPTLEGAGVKLRRAFGFGETEEFDPFLLLDDFRNENPEDYLKGFPWHAHRGIETITYVLAGTVSHGDSLGNSGTLGGGGGRRRAAGRGGRPAR